MRWFRVIVFGVAFFVLSGSAVALPSAPVGSPIEGTDLTIAYPDGWRLQPRTEAAEEIRAFVDEFPAAAAQLGLRSSDTDAQLLRTWKETSKDIIERAFDPTDGDAVTVYLYTGKLWPNLRAWRTKQRSNAKAFNAKVVALNEAMIGTHPTYTSILKLRDHPLLIATAAIGQPDGKYVLVSIALDGVDQSLAEQILASLKPV